MKMMSYIIKDDYGFAPNPYGGFFNPCHLQAGNKE